MNDLDQIEILEDDYFEQAQCQADEHEMMPGGDNDSQWYFCVKCGTQTTTYITQSWVSELY